MYRFIFILFLISIVFYSKTVWSIPYFAFAHNEHPDHSTSTEPTHFVSSFQDKLVGFTHKTIDTAKRSYYKLGGTHFDVSRGIYIVDCSNYVDRLLETVSPNAYTSLVNWSGSDKPTSQHYYDLFTELSDESVPYWGKVAKVNELKPGDILVFRKKNYSKRHTAGHVMVVMDKQPQDTNTFLVRVADAAPVGHSQDTRPSHTSGIGIGNLLLKVNPKTGEPDAYAWKVGSCWKKNVNFAMARPLDIF